MLTILALVVVAPITPAVRSVWAADATPTRVVDADTTNAWTNFTRPGNAPSTQNIGRLWTDKSVFNDTYTFQNDNDEGLAGHTVELGDSDFLVSFSALSSTSNLRETVLVPQPLDIELVLDTSSSMDTDGKIDTLKTAAKNFVEATREANSALEESQQSRIGIVSFNRGAEVVSGLGSVTDQTAATIENEIDGLDPYGETYADEGMELAATELAEDGRQGVQKVILFFTDGEPNHGNNFDGEVAASAVKTAHTLKQDGTIIYAVGVMEGADASVTDDQNFNAYMNALSSNYPDATATGEPSTMFMDGSIDVNFGDRAETGDYYKASENASDIENIFEEISQEVQETIASGSPIEEVTQEGHLEAGNLIFTDQLGSYMQVTGTGAGVDKMQLAYADTLYTSESVSVEGNVATYHFTGEVEGNDVYGATDLSELVVKVTRGANLADGDYVEVEIPASLIPMRDYAVDVDEGTMTVSQAYPVRLFYGVSLKEEAANLLAHPESEGYIDLIKAQRSADGKTIDFYSNSFIAGASDGSASASFQANVGNKFYYYTQDATLYIDEACQIAATPDNISGKDALYWSDAYWVQTDGIAAEQCTSHVPVAMDSALRDAMVLDNSSNTYYIPAGTQRLNRPATLTMEKGENLTGTASNVLHPTWTQGGAVRQALGNNGKLSYPVPPEVTTDLDGGTAFQVTKQVEGADALEAFTFTLELKDGDASKVFEGSGDSKTLFDGMTVTTTDNIEGATTETVAFGDITFMAAGDYTFVIDEITTTAEPGWTYDSATHEVTVRVQEIAGDLQITSVADNNPTFTNRYGWEPLQVRAAHFGLAGSKTIQGREWETGDEFAFTLTPGLGDNTDGTSIPTEEMTATLPASTSDTIRPADGDGSRVSDTSAQFTFADERHPGEEIVEGADDIFTFTHPGTYRYLIRETNPNLTTPGSGILGMSYDATIYRLTVTVTDDGDGTLSATGAYTKRNADGSWQDLTGGQDIQFVNTYASDTRQVAFHAFKVLDGRTTNMVDGEFTFQMTFAGWAENDVNADPADDAAWTLDNTTAAPAAAADMKNVVRGDVTFPEMTFTADNVGYTYRYAITEVHGGETIDGVTYDASKCYVTAKVTSEQKANTEGGGYIEYIRIETSGEAAWNDVANTAPTTGAIFTNTYAVAPASSSLTIDGGVTIDKILNGRDLVEGEFTAVMVGSDGQIAARGTNDETGSIELSAITFTAPGTYRYALSELDQGQIGITYDDARYVATARVTDQGDGTLAVAWELVDETGEDVSGVTFVNTFQPLPARVQVHATKVLEGADLEAGAYTFELVTLSHTPAPMSAEGTAVRATNDAFGDIVFDSIALAEDGTYLFELREVAPEDDDARKDGIQHDDVTYDEAVYQVAVTVATESDGTRTAEVVYNTADGEAPTFVNTYEAPVPASAEMVGDEGDGGEKIVATYDVVPFVVGAAAIIGAAACAAGIVNLKKRSE